MTTLTNKHGKTFDDFDRVVLEHCVQQLVPRGGFSVISEGGYAMFGYVPNEPICEPKTFTAIGWRTDPLTT